ncbi:MAG: hypothetical protein UH654_03665 [Lachnospiraceae bacterium]|nr:hypothetical protein [Lachnospiraceae bacterium]
MGYKTAQEEFWSGQFGNDYIERNKDNALLEAKMNLWMKVLECTKDVESVIEFGSNIGLNLKTMKIINSKLNFAAVEINHKAVDILKNDALLKDCVDVYEQSILEYNPEKMYDLAFTAGVLIHINPDELQNVYEKLYKSSKKYICVAEYYNPSPVVIPYRDNQERLFKRDFAGEIMDKYSDLQLVNYGFVYHRDNNFPLDDFTWFLLEKK